MSARPAVLPGMLGRLGVLGLLAAACAAPPPPERAYFPAQGLHAPVFSAPQVLADAQRSNFGERERAVVLALDEQSSLRAVRDAALRLRERGLSVGYWLDAPPADRLDVDARVARARAMLQDRPHADALFVPALQGRALPCGCSSATCARTATDGASDPRAAARLLAALEGFADGALVIPVLADRGDESALACSASECREAGCAAREELAFAALVQRARHFAVLFDPGALARARDSGADLAAYVARRLAERGVRAARVRAALPTRLGTSAGAVIACLPAVALPPADLAAAVAGVRAAPRSGWILIHAPLRALSVAPFE